MKEANFFKQMKHPLLLTFGDQLPEKWTDLLPGFMYAMAERTCLSHDNHQRLWFIITISANHLNHKRPIQPGDIRLDRVGIAIRNVEPLERITYLLLMETIQCYDIIQFDKDYQRMSYTVELKAEQVNYLLQTDDLNVAFQQWDHLVKKLHQLDKTKFKTFPAWNTWAQQYHKTIPTAHQNTFPVPDTQFQIFPQDN